MNPPPPEPKKKGMGCLGCGFLILVILLVLIFGFLGTMTYLAYSKFMSVTTTEPGTVQTFDGGDDMYNRARQKLADFDHDLNNHLAATIHLNADEINTLIARDPDFAKNNIHLFVTINAGQIEAQVSLPSALISRGWVKDRYLNGDVTLGLNFDPTAKNLDLDLQDLHVSGQEIPKDNLPAVQTELNLGFSYMLQSDPEARRLLQQASSIEVTGSEIVIEIK